MAFLKIESDASEVEDVEDEEILNCSQTDLFRKITGKHKISIKQVVDTFFSSVEYIENQVGWLILKFILNNDFCTLL